MNSNMISKVQKARNYAEERNRVTLESFSASFRGNHNSYNISYDGGAWKCDCSSFQLGSVCSHIMAMERILEGMLTVQANSEAA